MEWWWVTGAVRFWDYYMHCLTFGTMWEIVHFSRHVKVSQVAKAMACRRYAQWHVPLPHAAWGSASNVTPIFFSNSSMDFSEILSCTKQSIVNKFVKSINIPCSCIFFVCFTVF